jgi:hypothetical protein
VLEISEDGTLDVDDTVADSTVELVETNTNVLLLKDSVQIVLKLEMKLEPVELATSEDVLKSADRELELFGDVEETIAKPDVELLFEIDAELVMLLRDSVQVVLK